MFSYVYDNKYKDIDAKNTIVSFINFFQFLY